MQISAKDKPWYSIAAHCQHNIKEFPKENNIGRQLNICANPKIVKTKVHKRKKKVTWIKGICYQVIKE